MKVAPSSAEVVLAWLDQRRCLTCGAKPPEPCYRGAREWALPPSRWHKNRPGPSGDYQ